MDERVRQAVERLEQDRTSGASQLMEVALEAVKLAALEGADAAAAAARAVVEAQPAMASFHNLARAVEAEKGQPGALDLFERRWRRAPAALVRVAREALAPEPALRLRFVTCSFSGTVLACLRAIASSNPLHVTCGEGRPVLEGRRMAEALAGAGIGVELRTDAALAGALPGCDGLLLGADAVTPAWFLNKCGTLQVTATAGLVGAAVYVLATRDKFVDLETGELLRIDDRDAREVWDAAPPGVSVANPYFERVPLALATAVITDGLGPRASPAAASACTRSARRRR